MFVKNLLFIAPLMANQSSTVIKGLTKGLKMKTLKNQS